MKILIYGTGAVGLGIASCLMKSKNDVSLLARPATAQALKKRGLKRSGIFGKTSASPDSFECYTSLKKAPKHPYDFILVTTKSFDTLATAQDLHLHQSLFNQDTKIILCQNGWGNAEIFVRQFSPEIIYNARVITGFIRTKPNEVKITVHADAVKIGSLFDNDLKPLQTLCQSISKGGLPCEISTNISKDLWAKMLYNCALNPLGAILNVPYGNLGKHSATWEIMNEIVLEVFQVMKAAGYSTHWPTPASYLNKFYSDFLPSTAKHSSSMLQDIKAKKPTEIDALNGIVIQVGKRFKIPTPVNETIYRILKYTEHP